MQFSESTSPPQIPEEEIPIRFQAKNEIRKKIKAVRNAYPGRVRRSKSEQIHQRVVQSPPWQKAKHVAFYFSQNSEVETAALIQKALNEKKNVYLPKISMEDFEMEFRKVTSLDELQEGAYGIMEPPKDAHKIEGKDLELLFVPALAVDLQGYRIGYGAGYYDRFLDSAKNCISAALVFDFQLITEVPRTPNDQPVSWIVTEQKIVQTQLPTDK